MHPGGNFYFSRTRLPSLWPLVLGPRWWHVFRQYEVTPNLQNVDLPVILKLPHKKYTGITTYKEESQ